MRLGQLARQLNLKTEQIVEFLASREIVIDPGNNTKLDEAHAILVQKHFAPEMAEPLVEVPEPAGEESQAVVEDAPAETLPDLIKAPKVELPGLKVLGKIELPEKKKKAEEAAETQETAEPERKRRPAQSERRRESRPWRNPLEEKRKNEDREKASKMAAEREAAKERKTAYYMKRLKPQPPTKAVRINQEEYAEEIKTPEAPVPRTWVGKFIAWLNGR